MFKIGDFSKIMNVPITQLRYYDDIDIFKPRHTDGNTGYRYYSIEQMPQLNRILALRDLGMSLEQIKQMLSADISVETLREMFAVQKAQVEQTILDEIVRLKAIEYRLNQIEQEGTLANYDVVLKDLPQQPMLARRIILSEWQWAITFFNDIQAMLDEQSRPFKGTPSALIYAISGNNASSYDVELGFIGDERLSQSIVEQFDLTVRTLDEVKVATLLQQGGAVNGYAVVANWVEHSGYQMAGPIRELYWNLADTFESPDLLIEYQFPVKHA